MTIEQADPFLGDIVRGPDGTTGRVCGTRDEPSGERWVLCERQDGTTIDWREGAVMVVVLCEDVPLSQRHGRKEGLATFHLPVRNHPLWILERGMVAASDCGRWVAALKANESQFTLVDFVPFSHTIQPEVHWDPTRTIPLGSTAFIRSALGQGWKVWYGPQFSVSHWDILSQDLLNPEPRVVPFRDITLDHATFIRPVEDLKIFPGTVVHPDNLSQWIERTLFYAQMAEEPLLSGDTLCALSQPQAIFAEYRFFIVNQRVVAGSRYRLMDRLEEVGLESGPAWNYAQKVVDKWTPAAVFVVDIADTPKGFRVIEFNCFNSAGTYQTRLEPVVRAIEESP